MCMCRYIQIYTYRHTYTDIHVHAHVNVQLLVHIYTCTLVTISACVSELFLSHMCGDVRIQTSFSFLRILGLVPVRHRRCRRRGSGGGVVLQEGPQRPGLVPAVWAPKTGALRSKPEVPDLGYLSRGVCSWQLRYTRMCVCIYIYRNIYVYKYVHIHIYIHT